MNRPIAILLAVGIVIFATGCDDRFRYQCQDSANWDKPECKRPVCAVSQTCPDMVNKMEEITKGDVR